MIFGTRNLDARSIPLTTDNIVARSMDEYPISVIYRENEIKMINASA
jgi:hypothetical protein